MSDTWRFPPPLLLLLLLGALCGADTRCAPTSFYRNCWIRRFPGIFIDVDESARRGAQLLRGYEENSALQCSRSCCLSRNFSCNLAVFHYDTVQETVNCFHLHCPTMESCILKHRGNVILYNITAGADPDLLVFGKYFSNTRAWPQLSSRLNSSDGHVSDKRHFNRLPVAPVLPRTPSSSPRPGNKFTVSSTSVTHAPPPVSAVGSAGTSPTPRGRADGTTVSNTSGPGLGRSFAVTPGDAAQKRPERSRSYRATSAFSFSAPTKIRSELLGRSVPTSPCV
ncbi:MANSC domain-containing protein 4-like [Arapaima gigas]